MAKSIEKQSIDANIVNKDKSKKLPIFEDCFGSVQLTIAVVGEFGSFIIFIKRGSGAESYKRKNNQ